VNWKSTQNADGGWAYSRGCSWTEPTALVLLAQAATGIDKESFASGVKFIRSLEGPDGGWRPQPGVAESTWVTALVGLLPAEAVGVPQHRRAIDWLRGQTGRESGWRYRFDQWLHGNKQEFPEGWPWFPGAAAWVIPTSLAVLAFEREVEIHPDSELQARIAKGKQFLISHMCADGGWNHGSNQALGRDGDSYPETTGIALLATRGMNVDRSLAMAKKHLADCRSAEGIAWLRMGLAAHGDNTRGAADPPRRTITDSALWELAAVPRNPLLTGMHS
jgi:hypothetical protein